jgi:hypothetical protein
MDIVRIILSGYGCEVSRGLITNEEYEKIEQSDILDDIWVKGLYKYIGMKWKRIDLQQDYGITSGDVLITVNDEVVMDLPITVLESMCFDDGGACVLEDTGYVYPNTTDIVMTTIQEHSGLISDILFMINGYFDIRKLKFIRKEVHNENNEVIINSLISEVYYDDEPIPFGGSNTDLRMSNIYFDIKKNEKKR